MRARPLAFLLFGLGLTPAAWATDFLVVYFDDLGADKVGAYLDDMYPQDARPVYLPETPNIDTLASIGLRFTTAYAQPLCSPSRASLLTGTWPHEHDVGTIISNSTPSLGVSATTLAEVLAASTVPDGPYVSGVFGKWHLGTSSEGGANWRTSGEYADAPNPARHGFAAYHGNLEGQVTDYYRWTETRWPVTLGTGATGSIVAQSTTWAPDAATDDLIDWAAAQTQPWLAIAAINAPHLDGEGTADTWEEDDLAPESAGACVQRDADPACHSKENYATLVEDADARIATLLTGLEAADPGVLSNLVVIVVADNGTPSSLLEAPWTASGERTLAGKNTGYESGLRVPLVIARGCDWLDLQDGAHDGLLADGTPACTDAPFALATPGLAVDAPVQIEDLFATVAGLAGAAITPPAASFDLAPCFAATAQTAGDCGSAALAERVLFGERFVRPYTEATAWGTTGPATKASAGARRADDKIVVGIGALGANACTTYEYYDLAADPHETDNLLVGGSMTEAQRAAYEDLWIDLRVSVAPDWLPTLNCAAGSPWDADGDRFESIEHGGVDCDDTTSTIRPGRREVKNDGIDSNCDGADNT